MTTRRLKQGGRSPQDKQASLLWAPGEHVYWHLVIENMYVGHVGSQCFLQPDSHGHKILQPLEVATLEANLLCPEKTLFCKKKTKLFFKTYLDHHSKVWFIIGQEEF